MADETLDELSADLGAIIADIESGRPPKASLAEALLADLVVQWRERASRAEQDAYAGKKGAGVLPAGEEAMSDIQITIPASAVADAIASDVRREIGRSLRDLWSTGLGAREVGPLARAVRQAVEGACLEAVASEGFRAALREAFQAGAVEGAREAGAKAGRRAVRDEQIALAVAR